MKRFLLWTAGIAAGLWLAKELRDAGLRFSGHGSVDLNQCSREDLMRVPGLTEALADRIIDNRPYRHRLDLVARMVVPSGVYQNIRDLVEVEPATVNRSIHVAS